MTCYNICVCVCVFPDSTSLVNLVTSSNLFLCFYITHLLLFPALLRSPPPQSHYNSFVSCMSLHILNKQASLKIWSCKPHTMETRTVCSLSVGYLTQCSIFQVHSFSCKIHNFVFLYNWIKLNFVYVPHFIYLSVDGHPG